MTAETQMPDHHDNFVVPSVDTLELAGALVSDEDLFLLWLDRADGEQTRVLLEARALIGHLQVSTRWEQAILLDELGCTPRTRAAVPSMSVEQLEACRDYFSWVWCLVNPQHDPQLCRAIVEHAWSSFNSSERDLDHVRRAFGFTRDDDGTWRPPENSEALELIASGDIDAAWSIAFDQHPAPAAPIA